MRYTSIGIARVAGDAGDAVESVDAEAVSVSD